MLSSLKKVERAPLARQAGARTTMQVRRIFISSNRPPFDEVRRARATPLFIFSEAKRGVRVRTP